MTKANEGKKKNIFLVINADSKRLKLISDDSEDADKQIKPIQQKDHIVKIKKFNQEKKV